MEGIRLVIKAFGLFGPVVWLLALALPYHFFAFDLSSLHGLKINDGALLGRDFVNIWEGGRIGAQIGADAVYDRDGYRQRLMQDVGIGGIYAFSYPPHLLALAIPFGWLPYWAALLAWTCGFAALFWHAARPWLREAGIPSWIALILPASLINIWAGHFGFLIGALALIGWRNAATNPVRSGFAFALMTVKPHLGILVPPLLVLARCWRAIGWAIAGSAALVLLSVALLGIDSWSIWITSTLPFQASLLASNDPDMTYIFMMPTVERLIGPLTTLPAAVTAAKAAFALGALAALGWAWRQGVALRDLALLSFIAVFLILPYSFIYDMTGVCLAVLIFAVRWHDRTGPLEHVVFGSAFLIPLLHPPMTHLGFAYSPLALLGAMLMATRLLIQDKRIAEGELSLDPAAPAAAGAARSA